MELSAIEYLKIKKRMCNYYKEVCRDCDLSTNQNGLIWRCSHQESNDPRYCVEVVTKFRDEKPEVAKFTYRDDFLSKFPGATRIVGSHPIPMCSFYGRKPRECDGDCPSCWDLEINE